MRFLILATLLSAGLLPASAQNLSLIPDPSGKTQYLAPKGWEVKAYSEQNNYYWIARESEAPGAPLMMSVIMPNEAGQLPNLLMRFLNEMIQDVEIQQAQQPSLNDYHVLLTGYINKVPTHMAAFIVRDPGRYLFINFLAGRPSRFDPIQGEFVLYECMRRQNPFDYSALNGRRKYLYDPLNEIVAGSYNMQSTALQEYIIERSEALTPAMLIGSWMQVMSYSTGVEYQHTGSGAISYGERGFAHLLNLKADGSYTITYSYKNFSGGCRNSAEMYESGKWSLANNELSLKRTQYNGDYEVCAQRTKESKQNLPDRVFKVGLHEDRQHMAIYGKPFEYSISTDLDATGEVLRLGFKKQP